MRTVLVLFALAGAGWASGTQCLQDAVVPANQRITLANLLPANADAETKAKGERVSLGYAPPPGISRRLDITRLRQLMNRRSVKLCVPAMVSVTGTEASVVSSQLMSAKQTPIVRTGEWVTVVLRNGSVQIEAQAEALASAAEGQSIPVRTAYKRQFTAKVVGRGRAEVQP